MGENSPIHVKKGHFPHLTGIDLLGNERQIPQSFKGKLNIVAVAFQREQQEMVNTWIPIADKIIEERKDVRFYEVPLIYELGGLYRGWINNGMRMGIPDPVARERTITVYTKRDTFLKKMNMKTSTIYVLITDESGKILWRTSGEATADNVKKLKAALSK